MKVILDTNVLVSGIFFKGPPFEILKIWKNKGFTLITTHEILEEYKRVVFELSKQFSSVDVSDVSDVMDIITLNSKMTFSISLPDQICEDPDDDKFISAALASRSKIIVSGDKHLLRINGYAGIKVFKPNEFLSRFLLRLK